MGAAIMLSMAWHIHHPVQASWANALLMLVPVIGFSILMLAEPACQKIKEFCGRS